MSAQQWLSQKIDSFPYSVSSEVPTASTLIDTPMFTPSPTVTQSPVMVGGVNVAAAVAIPVVLVLLLIVAVVCVGTGYYYLFYIPMQR